MNRPSIVIIAVFVALAARSASAHEYYLMPDSFTPAVGTEVAVDHRLGQKFKGNRLPYIGTWNLRSEIWEEGKKREVAGQDGDRPALKITSSSKQMYSVIHQSNVDFLTFKTWEKFQTYTKKEGLEYALADSENGTKPKIGLLEGYSRFAKTLIAPNGTVEGEDVPTGLKIELIALANPMTLKTGEALPVQLLYQGKPLAGATVKVFVGVGNEFTHRLISNGDGKVEIPGEGPGPYLLNAIHMTEPQSAEAKGKGAHWESFWASLTYRRNQ